MKSNENVVFSDGESLSADKIQKMIDTDQEMYDLLQNTAWGERALGFGFLIGLTGSFVSGGTPIDYYTEADRMLMVSFSVQANGDDFYSPYNTIWVAKLQVDGVDTHSLASGTQYIDTSLLGGSDYYYSAANYKVLVPNLAQGVHTFEMFYRTTNPMLGAADSMSGSFYIEDVGKYIAPQ